jgi:hypothetical protein
MPPKVTNSGGPIGLGITVASVDLNTLCYLLLSIPAFE